jgi:O-antigen ligase
VRSGADRNAWRRATPFLSSFKQDPTLIVRSLLVAALFITPAVFDLGAVKPFDIVKATTVLFFGWLLFGAWTGLYVHGVVAARRSAMGRLAIAFLLASALATLLSPTHWTSLFGWYGRYNGFVQTVVLVLVFVAVSTVYRGRPERTYELVWALAAASVVVAIYVLVQRVGLDPIRWAQPAGGVPGAPYFGTMGNADFAGGYLGLTSPWLYLAYRRCEPGWRRRAVVAWGSVHIVALYVTSARNGMVAVAAATAALLFVHRRRVPAIVKAGAIAAAVLVIVLGLVVVFHPGSKRPPPALRRVDVLRSKTVRVRGYWWLAGLKMFVHRPLTGWGPDSFVTQYPKYLSRGAASLGDSETADKPHNVFIEHAAQTGVLGFGAYVALIVVAFRRALRRLRDGPPDQEALVAVFVALLAAYVGQAFFSIDVAAMVLTGWVVLGAIAAMADPPDNEREESPRRPREQRRLVTIAAIVVALVLATASTAPLKADHEARTAGRLANAEAPADEVITHYERAMSWQPLEALYRGTAGDYLERQASASEDVRSRREMLRRAVAYYEEMNRLQPGYSLWKYSVGKAMGSLAAAGGASFDGARRWLAEAARLAPYDWRIVIGQAELYNKWAVALKGTHEAAMLLCRALGKAREASSLRKTRGDVQLTLGLTLARLGQLDHALVALRKAAKHERSRQLADRYMGEVEKLERAKTKPPVVSCR